MTQSEWVTQGLMVSPAEISRQKVLSRSVPSEELDDDRGEMHGDFTK